MFRGGHGLTCLLGSQPRTLIGRSRCRSSGDRGRRRCSLLTAGRSDGYMATVGRPGGASVSVVLFPPSRSRALHIRLRVQRCEQVRPVRSRLVLRLYARFARSAWHYGATRRSARNRIGSLGGGKPPGAAAPVIRNAPVPGLLGERQGRRDRADASVAGDPHDASPTPIVHGEPFVRGGLPPQHEPGGRNDPTATKDEFVSPKLDRLTVSGSAVVADTYDRARRQATNATTSSSRSDQRRRAETSGAASRSDSRSPAAARRPEGAARPKRTDWSTGAIEFPTSGDCFRKIDDGTGRLRPSPRGGR